MTGGERIQKSNESDLFCQQFLLSRAAEREVGMKKDFSLSDGEFSRRHFLISSSLVAAASALQLPNRAEAMGKRDKIEPFVYDGSDYPFPIPWLDKNGSHNQPAGPNLEPSHIYHFKGKVARCADFRGMGTDNKGNRLAFGNPTTDNDIMQGEYYTGRTAQQGTFAHL